MINIKRVPRSKGFTLIEVIVSVGIMAVVTLAAVSSITQFIKSREIIEYRQSVMEELNSFFLFLERDLSYVVARPLRTSNKEHYAALEVYLNSPRNSGELMQFTTSYPIPGSTSQKTERVSWRLSDDSIYRVVWDFLDHSDESYQSDDESNAYVIKQHMLSGVEKVEVNVFRDGADDKSVEHFNEGVIDDASRIDLYVLPRLVEVIVTYKDRNSQKSKRYRRLMNLTSPVRGQ